MAALSDLDVLLADFASGNSEIISTFPDVRAMRDDIIKEGPALWPPIDYGGFKASLLWENAADGWPEVRAAEIMFNRGSIAVRLNVTCSANGRTQRFWETLCAGSIDLDEAKLARQAMLQVVARQQDLIANAANRYIFIQLNKGEG